jgi:Spy/CpxP family protein refolding chaperone
MTNMEAKTKRTLVIWGVILLILLNVSSLGTIWYHRYHSRIDRADKGYSKGQMRQGAKRGMRHKPRGSNIISRGLDLTSIQQEKFDSIWQLYNERRVEVESNLENNRAKMGAVMSSNNLDTSAYYHLSQLQLTLIGTLDKAMLDMNMAFRETLTEDQTRLFLEKVESMNQTRIHERSPEAMKRRRVK